MKRVFFDSNVLVYSVDGADNRKQQRAIELLEEHFRHQTGVVSTQVLQEFFVVATRKLSMPALEAKGFVERFRRFEVIQVTEDLIEGAINRTLFQPLSFWDALIVETALLAKCAQLYSEDINAGERMGACELVNPFDE